MYLHILKKMSGPGDSVPEHVASEAMHASDDIPPDHSEDVPKDATHKSVDVSDVSVVAGIPAECGFLTQTVVKPNGAMRVTYTKRIRQKKSTWTIHASWLYVRKTSMQNFMPSGNTSV